MACFLHRVLIRSPTLQSQIALVPAERDRPNHVYNAFAPSLPRHDGRRSAKVLQYKQLSNHPEFQSIEKSRKCLRWTPRPAFDGLDPRRALRVVLLAILRGLKSPAFACVVSGRSVDIWSAVPACRRWTSPCRGAVLYFISRNLHSAKHFTAEIARHDFLALPLPYLKRWRIHADGSTDA